MTEEQRHHGAERDPECPPQLGSAACAATDESDAGEDNGLRQDLQRYRAAHCKKDCGKAAHRILPNRAFFNAPSHRITPADSTPGCTTIGNVERRVVGRLFRLRSGGAAPSLE